MPTQVIMPQLGESVIEGTVTKWLHKEGESIQEYEPLLEVTTDKVDTEIPSPAGGVLLKVLVTEGSTVGAGSILAWIGQPGEAIPQEGAAKAAAPTHQTAPEEDATAVTAARRVAGFISPVVARLAEEHKIDLTQVKGTGEGGRITKRDILAYLESRQPAGPAAAPPAPWETPGEGDLFRPTEMVLGKATPPVRPPGQQAGDILPVTRLRKAIADHMVLSKRISPHVTTVMEADLQRVVAHYQVQKPLLARQGVNLTYSAYFVAAAVAGLKEFPLVNSTWAEEGIALHAAINIGLAVSLGEEGLIVPVVKNADQLSVAGLARAINDLAGRSRSHDLKPDEVQGGTFTITNHGTGGSLFATPIINQPQCAILGIGAIKKRVVVLADDAIAIRPMVYLSLTFDHRILDGAAADGFLGKVVKTLEKWE